MAIGKTIFGFAAGTAGTSAGMSDTLRRADILVNSQTANNGKITNPDVYFNAIKFLMPYSNNSEVAAKILTYKNQALALQDTIDNQTNSVNDMEAKLNNNLRNVSRATYTNIGDFVNGQISEYYDFLTNLDQEIQIRQANRESTTDFKNLKDKENKQLNDLIYLSRDMRDGNISATDNYGLFVKTDPGTGNITDIQLSQVDNADTQFSKTIRTDSNYFGIPVYSNYTQDAEGNKTAVIGNNVFNGAKGSQSLASKDGSVSNTNLDFNSIKWNDLNNVNPGSVMVSPTGNLYYVSSIADGKQIYKASDLNTLSHFIGESSGGTYSQDISQLITPITFDEEQSLGSLTNPDGTERVITPDTVKGLLSSGSNQNLNTALNNQPIFPSLNNNVSGSFSTAPLPMSMNTFGSTKDMSNTSLLQSNKSTNFPQTSVFNTSKATPYKDSNAFQPTTQANTANSTQTTAFQVPRKNPGVQRSSVFSGGQYSVPDLMANGKKTSQSTQ